MKQQKHSGTGDNIYGNKEIFISIKFTKYIIYFFVGLILVGSIVFYFIKDKIVEEHLTELFQEVGSSLDYYRAYGNTSSYTKIKELNSEIQELLEKGLELTGEQELLYASSLSTIGNYKDALPHFKKAYFTSDINLDISNSVTTLTSFCYCSAYANKNIDEAIKEYEILRLKIKDENNYEYKRLEGDIYMCKAVNCSQQDDIQCVTKNLNSYAEYYSPSSHIYINSIDYNLSDVSKKSKGYLEILNELKLIYEQKANLMNSK